MALSPQSCRNGADEARDCNQVRQRAPFDDWLASEGKKKKGGGGGGAFLRGAESVADVITS